MPERKFHPSHQSDTQHKAILEYYTPLRPRICQMCGWQGSMDNVCTVCLEMVKTLLQRPSHYWLDLEAQDKIRERLRKQAEGGSFGFTT